jgi:hypothetical protein
MDMTVLDVLIGELAYARAIDPEMLRAEMEANGGDLEIDSKVGQFVAVRAEIALDMDGAIRPEDQDRDILTSLRSLERLILERRADYEARS